MSSTATDLLKLEKAGLSDYNNTWHTHLHEVFTRIEEAIADITNIVVTASDYTLDDTQYIVTDDATPTAEAHVAAIKATGTLTGNRSVIVPSRNKLWWIWNATGGAFSLTVKTVAGAGIAVPQGYLMGLICDGTNVEALTVPTSVEGNVSIIGNLVSPTITTSPTAAGATWTDLGSVTTVDINGGTIDGITDLAVVDGGTGASSAGDARTNLGLVIGTNVQAEDAGLTSIAGLTTLADRMIYTTASDTYAVTTLSSFARTILDDSDAATVRTTIGAPASTDHNVNLLMLHGVI